jgi:hypothetical protein
MAARVTQPSLMPPESCPLCLEPRRFDSVAMSVAVSMQGHGTYFMDNGDTYEGDWVSGQRHGRGRAVYGGRPIDNFGGDVYEGHWENDMK